MSLHFQPMKSFYKSLLIGLASSLPFFTTGAQSTKKPNIIFILADDLGRHQIGAYGSTFYETPHIDKLAKSGLKFSNAYAASPVCSPTRASIMTGKYPARLHLTDYIPGRSSKNSKLITPNWKKELPLEEITIAEVLQDAGYATGHFGKWHLNKDKKYKLGRPGDPGSQGFDDVLTTHKPRAGPKSKFDEDWHHVREITERSVAFIKKNKDQPFFCYVTHNSIHDPEIEKKSLIEKYAKKTELKKLKTNNPKQAAMLETLDKSIGTILDTLEELELENNTLVVFNSDNGQKGSKEGKPFRGSKGDLYEAGIRMPLIIRWPGVVKPGSESAQFVISNDFFPTFTDLAGGISKEKDIDGVSLMPVLRDSGAKLTRESLCWHYPHYHGLGIAPSGAIRKGRYKLIEWFEKSTYGEDGAYELYDLMSDPGESWDLSASMKDKTAELKNELEAWRNRVGAQMMPRRK